MLEKLQIISVSDKVMGGIPVFSNTRVSVQAFIDYLKAGEFMMENAKLYDRDFNLWLESQVIAIETKNLKAMDWDNLLEEIEYMAARDKRALKSYFIRLVQHLLKIRDWEQERKNNINKWRVEVRNFRREIELILEDSPSLRNYLEDNYRLWFDKAVKEIEKDNLFEIKNTETIFLEEILDKTY